MQTINSNVLRLASEELNQHQNFQYDGHLLVHVSDSTRGCVSRRRRGLSSAIEVEKSRHRDQPLDPTVAAINDTDPWTGIYTFLRIVSERASGIVLVEHTCLIACGTRNQSPLAYSSCCRDLRSAGYIMIEVRSHQKVVQTPSSAPSFIATIS